MKVFHILSNPGIGGIEGMLSELIPKIDKNSCDMRVVNMRSESKAYPLWDKTNVPYCKLKTPSKLLLGSIFGFIKLLRKEKPDILEIYGLRANIIGRLAGKLAGVPVIITGVLSTDDWRKWYHVWLDRATGWAVDSWIANSKACKKSVVDREKYPPERISVIYDGIDISYWTKVDENSDRERLRREWGFSEDNIVFVTVANLRPDKGVQFLIEAIPAVLDKQPKSCFVLVGSDWMGGKLQNRCKQLGIENAVIFTGFRRDIHAIYQAADAAVLPSLREGLPICLIEAMSMELPIVASMVSGIPELVVEGQTGLLVPSRNIEALTIALQTIGQNEIMRMEMGKAGKKRVRENFTIERMAKELIEYYDKKLTEARK
jgi:glycosyltransferase involved in cell wall biosynthesis